MTNRRKLSPITAMLGPDAADPARTVVTVLRAANCIWSNQASSRRTDRLRQLGGRCATDVIAALFDG